ncbi:alkaline phosphatase family protein [Umezawaea sp. Da 62-37]|uniref:alkaline phosphatase family protein n=1 Tax=Umezawaea sp. Da 62-37 TaxID=3075927 RepID=UPI0028F6C080|nr:alkaline phosphatase family protein [Umezawaea sp. Da 62-37]WNV84991.1 alkaline phosphatase family protein [Umezawaea sp. Da 62-37]
MSAARVAPQLAVVGLDGVSFNVLMPMVDRGILPNFRRLLDLGAHGPLISTVPWQTPVAWTSMATGVNPGGHGVYGWWNPDLRSGELVPVSGAQVERARYWEVLSGTGVAVGVVNVPMSYPARPVRGFTIAGLDCPSSAPEEDPLLAYPRGVLDEVARTTPDGVRRYRVMPERLDGEDTLAAATRWTEVERHRADSFFALVERYRPGFVQLNLFATDHIAHRTRPGDPARDLAYRSADEFLGRFLDRYPDTDVLVVSDHGSCPIDHFLMVHNFLRELDVLHFGPWLADEQVPVVLGPHASAEECARLVERLRREGRGTRAEMFERHRDRFPGANVGFSTIDWDRTSAFCTSDYGQLRINRERGAGAVVSDAKHRRLLERLGAAFLDLRRPSGEPLVERVLRRDELYRGPHAAAGPDLTPVPAATDVYFCQVYSFYGTGEGRLLAPIGEVVDPARTGCAGDHHAEGVLIAAGPRITARGRLAEASLLDIAPTVLDLFGVEPLPEHEGVVLADLRGRDRRGPSPGEPVDEQAEGLRRRLMSLGYRI